MLLRKGKLFDKSLCQELHKEVYTHEDFCKKEATVTLLGHGLMNRLIGKELVRRGWKSQGKMGSDNWDYGMFELESRSR